MPNPVPLGHAGQITPNRPAGQHWSITVQELLDIPDIIIVEDGWFIAFEVKKQGVY